MPDSAVPQVNQIKIPKSPYRRKVILGMIFSILIISVGLGAVFYLAKYSEPLVIPESGQSENRAPRSTPFPFEELTVPFLRQKTYQSKLADLNKISDNGNFTSYLTSYDSDGLKINGLLTIPDGEPPPDGFPAIVFIHGYIPPNQYQTLTRYIDHVNSLASNGFVVFKIDLRGHGDSEGEAGGGYFSGDYVTDTLNAYSALESSTFINSHRIGLWGHSMAGNIVLRSMAVKPGIPSAVIWAGAVYTYTDMQQYGIQDSSYQPQPSDSERQRKRQQLASLYGDPTSDSWFWKQVAPANYLSDLKGAVQLNHAVNDDVINIEYSRNLNKLLNQSQVPHELNEYPSGGHNINGPNFNQAMRSTVRFFKEHLK